ncbi:hypothetical protein STANM309S_02433 [Streptomyces tanashiensis]
MSRSPQTPRTNSASGSSAHAAPHRKGAASAATVRGAARLAPARGPVTNPPWRCRLPRMSGTASRARAKTLSRTIRTVSSWSCRPRTSRELSTVYRSEIRRP